MAEIYLQRGLKKDKPSYRKVILFGSILFIVAVIIAPLLWVNGKPPKVAQPYGIFKVDPSAVESGKIVLGKVPKVTIVSPPTSATSETSNLQTGGAASPKENLEGTPPERPKDTSSSEENSKPREANNQMVASSTDSFKTSEEIKRKLLEAEETAKEAVAKSAQEEIASLKAVPETSQNSKPELSKTTVAKESADKKKTTLAKKSPPPSSTSSTLPSSSGSETTSGVGSATYWIQVGAYVEEANAIRAKNSIEKLGYEVVVKQTIHPRLGNIYVVRVPIKGTKEEAQRTVAVISQKTGDKPFIVEAK